MAGTWHVSDFLGGLFGKKSSGTSASSNAYVSSYKPPSQPIKYATPIYATPSGVSRGNVGSASGTYGSNWDLLGAISDNNNAFNLQQVEMVNAFNAREAQKNRDWQERMSNTAHQREVADLKDAGLNPILSALGGQGAYTGSGATASGQKAVADNTLGNGVISLMSSMIAASSAQSVANTYAAASMYSADKQANSNANYHKVLKDVASMNNQNANMRTLMNMTGNMIGTLMKYSNYGE